MARFGLSNFEWSVIHSGSAEVIFESNTTTYRFPCRRSRKPSVGFRRSVRIS